MQKNIHLIGIGGIGMSGLAHLLLAEKYVVSGSDIKANLFTEQLKQCGARIFIGHKSGNVPPETKRVVYSSSIARDNPEIKHARKNKLEIMPRAKMLSLLMEGKINIAVSGAHGKTTTTAMITALLKTAGFSPSYMIGAQVAGFGNSAARGEGQFFVVEADESDASFLYYKPRYSVVTNIDCEHLDHYGDMDNLFQAYADFLSGMEKDGCAFLCLDNENIQRLLKKYGGAPRVVSYGFSPAADVRATDLVISGKTSQFTAIYKNKDLGRFKLQVPGRHNVVNSLAVIALAEELHLALPIVQATLAAYQGAERRFQIKNPAGLVMVVDDYGHHPTEISATLAAAREFRPKRIIAVFQPHRYTRTKLLFKEFGACFHGADEVIITDIYSAQETPIAGVSSQLILDAARANGHGAAIYQPKQKIIPYLMDKLGPGDMVIFLGAGDITVLSNELAEGIKLHGNAYGQEKVAEAAGKTSLV